MVLKFIFALLISLIFFPPVFALEPGWYGHNTGKDKEIFDVEKQADRTLRCAGMDKIDIGVRRNVRAGSNMGEEAFFSRDEQREFFRQERHKDTIVVYFNPFRSGSDEEVAEGFERYLVPFGYRRILIAISENFGYRLLKDISTVPEKDSANH